MLGCGGSCDSLTAPTIPLCQGHEHDDAGKRGGDHEDPVHPFTVARGGEGRVGPVASGVVAEHGRVGGFIARGRAEAEPADLV